MGVLNTKTEDCTNIATTWGYLYRTNSSGWLCRLTNGYVWSDTRGYREEVVWRETCAHYTHPFLKAFSYHCDGKRRHCPSTSICRWELFDSGDKKQHLTKCWQQNTLELCVSEVFSNQVGELSHSLRKEILETGTLLWDWLTCPGSLHRIQTTGLQPQW